MGKFVWICGTGGAGGMDGTWGTEGMTPVRTVYSGSSAVFGICGSFASSDTSCGVAEATRADNGLGGACAGLKLLVAQRRKRFMLEGI